MSVDVQLRALFDELAEKTGLLQTTFGTMSQGIFMVDAQGRVSTFNQRLCELLDLPTELLATHPTLADLARFQWQRGDFDAEGTQVSPALHQAIITSTPLVDNALNLGVYTRTTRSGRVLEVKTQSMEGGGMVRTVTDISNFAQAEQDREHLHRLLKATQVMAQMGGWEVDVVKDKVFWTDEVYKILDTSPQEYTPTTATTLSFFAPESVKKITAAIQAGVAHGIPHDLELEMITAKGRRIWVHSRSMLTQVQGKVIKRTSVIQDITARKQTVAALKTSEENLRHITSQVPGMLFRVLLSSTGTRSYSFVSEGVFGLYGVTPDAVVSDPHLLDTFRLPEDRAAVIAEVAQACTSKASMVSEFRIRHRLGHIKWVHITSSWIGDADGGSLRSGVMVDITERKRIELELRETEARWKLALESTGDGMWDWYIQTGVEIYSKRYLEMYGYKEGEFKNLATEFDQLTHPDDLPKLLGDRLAHFDGIAPTYVNEHRILCRDGSWKWIMSRGMVIERDAAGQPVRMIGTHTDISARKKAEALIWQQANFDALTGLPNRRMLRDRIERDIEGCQRTGERLAVLFIDLDHFKEVNDTLGHAKGDMLLIEAARRIAAKLGQHDTVARMGGDEFTVVLHDVATKHVGKGARAGTPAEVELERQAAQIGHIGQVVHEILGAMATAFQLGDEQVFVSASIGGTLYPQDATEVENLFKNADQALYVAKGAGRNRFSFFTPELQLVAQNRARLASDLRVGLINQQFFMVYQPIVELKTGIVRKAEALIRWQHPTRGLISPADFIPIAEASGLIIDIGDWAFRHVATQTREWRATLRPDFQVSVNKSPAQFHHDGGSNQPWLDFLTHLGLPGEAIAVEITEGLLLDASECVTQQLLALRDAGVQVSLDDFGTGYSSLSYLQKFDIDTIKIDQSFVRHLIPDSTDLALCKAIIVMAHELGMKVVAEGIETEQQRDLLVAAGCDYGQGYWLARPMTANALEVFMSTQPAPAAIGL